MAEIKEILNTEKEGRMGQKTFDAGVYFVQPLL